jgi:tRNA A-37 threonylcarbamoyl transferase component Bud32
MDGKEERVEIRRELHLGRILGEGGMGQVYEGFEGGLGAHAAVKILREELLEDREIRDRFDGEVRIMSSIEHPGCLPIYGWGTDSKGRPFYAMKQVSGTTLAELLAERGDQRKSLVWRRRLLHIFQSICETMGYAHENGIVHRDLKPENIMIDPFGSVYVIDWGIAKRSGSDRTTTGGTRTLTGSVMGSPGYMAPEQADGKSDQAGPEADVFALGVILYEILTGEAPFEGSTERESMAHTVNRDPEQPRRKNLLLSRSISAVCMKALHKDPPQRYRNAAQFAEDITAFNEGRAVAVIKPSLAERASFYARREPVRAALTWALCFIVLAGLAVVVGQIWIDHRLAEKTWDNVALIDEDVEELRGEVEERKVKIAASSGQEKEIQEKELTILESRMLLGKVHALDLVRSVKRLRFLRSDPELDRVARERLFAIFEAGIDGKQALFLHAVVDSVLEDIEEGFTPIVYGPDDIARLREFQARAEKASGLRP